MRMRRLTGFLTTATVIGTALFSVTASAATLVPLAPIYDPTYKILTIGVGLDGNSPTGTVDFVAAGPDGPISLGRITVSNGVALLQIPLFPSGTLAGATYSGDAANPFTHVDFRIYWPSVDWVPVVLQGVLQD